MKLEGIPNHIDITTEHQHNVVVKMDYDTQEFVAETVKVVFIGIVATAFILKILEKV